MSNQLSKIWVVIILIIFGIGGISIWQYQRSIGKKPEIPKTERPEVKKDEIANWKVYKNKKHGFEMKYPKDWNYIILEIPNNPIMFTPENIIAKTEESLQNIESDKDFTLWITVYEKRLFERGILPYRGKSTGYIQVTSTDVNVGGINGTYYLSEYLKDKGSYRTGEKTATVDLAIKDGYLSMHLFDYQYVNIFEKMLSTFRVKH